MTEEFIHLMCEMMSKPPTHSTKDLYEQFKVLCKTEDVTACVLKQMFCENTGSHILDSGGACGRGWQRSQATKDQDWSKMESCVVNIDCYRDGEYDLYIVKNTYQILCQYLEYDHKMDKMFHKYAEGNSDSYYTNMREFVKYIKNFDDIRRIGGYNTYNGENCLDKTLQWEVFEDDDEEYIILQIHNGCDVRGGYSTPHIFRLEYDEFYCNLNDLSCQCESRKGGKHTNAYSDDCGYHWYSNSGVKEWKYITDDYGEHKAVCPECGRDIEFW